MSGYKYDRTVLFAVRRWPVGNGFGERTATILEEGKRKPTTTTGKNLADARREQGRRTEIAKRPSTIITCSNRIQQQ